MSSTASTAHGPAVTRRSVLVAAPAAALAGLALAACTDQAPPPSDPVPVDPDVPLREAAAEREQALLRSYDAVLAALPELAGRLLPVRGHHAEHLVALLGPAGSPSPGPGPGPVPSAGPSADASPTAPGAPAVPPPADAAQALSGLAAQERAAGDAHGAACLSASRSLAAVLASLSASELSHPVALG